MNRSFAVGQRVLTVAMAAVLAFGVVVPRAVQMHNRLLAVAVTVIFAAYLAANIVLWRRMKRRA